MNNSLPTFDIFVRTYEDQNKPITTITTNKLTTLAEL